MLDFGTNIRAQRGTFDLGVGGILPDDLPEKTFQVYPVPATTLRIWDAVGTLIGTPANDDLGITAGAFGTGTIYVTAGDLKAAGSTTRRARTEFTLPPEYTAGGVAKINFKAGMLTTISDNSATVDVEVYKKAGTTLKTGSDLVTTGATSINSLTFGEFEFTLTPDNLAPGDVLDVRVSITVNDAATVTAVTAAISDIEFLLTIKG